MFVVQLDLSLAPVLRLELERRGYVFCTPPHTIFSASQAGVCCTLYCSGKLVIQGKKSQELIEFYIEPELLQKLHAAENVEPHIGMDEAGKGDFFGPLCVAGLYASQEDIFFLQRLGIRDSKTVSDKQIAIFAEKIRQKLRYKILLLSPPTYNRLYEKIGNLNHLLAWAHTTVMEELVKKTGCSSVILDQFAHPSVVEKVVKSKNLTLNLVQKTQAEADVVVAGASILARDSFVRELDKLSQETGRTLPKGASSLVLTTGALLIQEKGKEILPKICKMHFKSYKEVLEKAKGLSS